MSDCPAEFAKDQQKIDRLVAQLQLQSDVPLWVVANRDAVRAIALNNPIQHGPRTRLVRLVFDIAGRSVMSFVALFFVGLMAAMKFWLRAVPVKPESADELLLGFGAGSEQELFERFQAKVSGIALHLDQNDPVSLAKVAIPPFAKLVTQLVKECVRVYSGFQRSRERALSDHYCMWMTLAAARIGLYAFAKVWAGMLSRRVRLLVFVAPDVQCHAAVDSRPDENHYRVEWWQHGMLARSSVYPRVDQFLAMTSEEAAHVHRLSGSPTSLYNEYKFVRRDVWSPTLLFASVYSYAGLDKANHIALLQELFAWAGAKGLKIVIRPHPREDPSFWHKHFPRIAIDQHAGSFSACVDRWNPMFVFSWFSTTLMDALRLGIIPVIIMEGSIPFLPDLVIPLNTVAVRWPEERALLENLAANADEYSRCLALRRGAISEAQRVPGEFGA